MNKPLSILILALIFIGLLFGTYSMWNQMKTKELSSELVEVDNNASVKITSPEPYAKITSPISISGEARGYWFFEASFPVQIIDGNGTVLGTGIAQAQGDWMTENYVPFATTVTFTAPATENGFILFNKDNPSGLPENDATIAVPITF